MRICFVGDSFVNGTGDPEYLGWTGRVCAAARRAGHDVTQYNLGVRRETSADIARRWRDEVDPRLADLDDGRVVFSFGTNDVTLENKKTRITLADTLSNTRAILTEAKSLYPVLFIGPPPTADADQSPLAAELSLRLSEVCAEVGVGYLDVFAALQASGTWLREAVCNDGAHPLAAGYAELAGLVTEWPAWQAWFPGT